MHYNPFMQSRAIFTFLTVIKPHSVFSLHIFQVLLEKKNVVACGI